MDLNINITLKFRAEPENPMSFERGATLALKGDHRRTLVVGEDDTHMHTFVLGTGEYWALLKTPEVAKRLTIIRPAFDRAGKKAAEIVEDATQVGFLKDGQTSPEAPKPDPRPDAEKKKRLAKSAAKSKRRNRK